ncbi:Erg28 like protein-domain-containing protein [Gilbertella persicaria]|uniref:Erg28 like protein-domain-containing protein n=1 Tax=Gilbertella persicaria TaxID=101096 RepID=UPI00221F2DAF|nr:Erg28 like protein-domain-containing protein [Gilbertella persicaria]KAI8047028.1 Erg28 like protein-domain-containing protein [Gilbertella persicaria]
MESYIVVSQTCFLLSRRLSSQVVIVHLCSCIFNSIQNFCTSSLTKRVYANKPEQVTPLSGRLFATWTWSVSMIRIYAAFHLQHKFMYDLGIDLFSSLIWLTQVKDQYVKFY